MDVVADDETDLAMTPEDLAAYRKLVSETGALFGARFLMAMSGEKLRLGFVVVLVALAGQMLLSAFGVHWGGHAT